MVLPKKKVSLTTCRYIICITIGPAFFSAAIYLCLARIVPVYGQHIWRVSPRFIAIAFILADVCALLLQVAGGGSSSHADPETRQVSLSILQAGLAVHLVGIFAFVVLSTAFAYLVRSNRGRWDPRLEPLQQSARFKAFLIGEVPRCLHQALMSWFSHNKALGVATVLILIRTAFRVAELSQGYKSDISRNEDLFFVLEGAVVLMASICLTAWHPGVAFQYLWQKADFQLKSSKGRRGARRELPGTINSSENGSTRSA
jgi:hypothetical protein